MHPAPQSPRPRTIRIRDRALHGAAKRLQTHSQALLDHIERVEGAADNRVEATVALLEAEVFAELVRAAVYEVALRLLPHHVPFDPQRQLARRLGPLDRAKLTFEQQYGPIVQA